MEHEDQIARLRDELVRRGERFDGMVHSIAFADYSDGMKPFHETPKKAFLQAVDISCFSLIALCNAMKDLLDPDASVVTISISTTRMASENYGYMAPIKAALDSSLAFLAKSFSRFSRVRFNAVAPGLLKTSASAGIPGYVDAYLYAEQVIPRKQAVRTEEVAARGRLPAEPAFQRHQRPADRRRRRHVDQLLRPRADRPGHASLKPSETIHLAATVPSPWGLYLT